jgi:hypothetical protein
MTCWQELVIDSNRPACDGTIQLLLDMLQVKNQAQNPAGDL